MKKRYLIVSLVMAALALYCPAAPGGDWHGSSTLICSDCHTMHNSQGGLPMRFDGNPTPADNLLRASTTNTLCLGCHDGTDANAPDVIAPVTYVSDPAGGFFANSGGTASDNAHNLGMATGETPPGGSDILILTCASCHEPHGSSNYRNLLLNPTGSGNLSDVTVTVTQSVMPDGSNPGLVYIPSNLVYRSGMAGWCNDCHTNFHGKTSGEEGLSEPWFRHPQDTTINGAVHADYTYWSGAITNRVEPESPTDTVVPSTDDEVFCLSCHKAHGSSNHSNLIYPDGSTLYSGCQQCHNQ